MYVHLHSCQTVASANAGAEIFRQIEAWKERVRERIEIRDRASEFCNEELAKKIKPERLRLYGQANKRIRWMPRRQEAMKDVVVCDKPRGAGKQALIRGFPNGETHCVSSILT